VRLVATYPEIPDKRPAGSCRWIHLGLARKLYELWRLSEQHRMQPDRDGLSGPQLSRGRAAVKGGHARLVDLVVLVDEHGRRAA
jgi:hypothetical protein